jgi:hypothetical protein
VNARERERLERGLRALGFRNVDLRPLRSPEPARRTVPDVPGVTSPPRTLVRTYGERVRVR